MRVLKFGSIAALVVAVIVASSFWAHQVIAERIAQSSFTSAQSKLSDAIQSARSQGLLPSELQPYAQELSSIASASPPKDPSFFSSTRAGFYSREATKLQHLEASLALTLRTTTQQARTHVRWIVWKYGQEVKTGRAQGMQLKRQLQVLSSARFNLSRLSSVGQYRSLAATAYPELQSLEQHVNQWQAEIARVRAAIRFAHHPIKALRSLVRGRVSAADGELATMAIFANASHYRHWLNRLAGWASSRTNVKQALLGAADVDVLAAKITAKLNKVTPAKWILVSTEGEWMQWYQGRTMVGSTLVTTGNPSLPTVKGHFHIIYKSSPFTFISTDPPSSPDWYPPSPVNYAMLFQSQGYFIHDAPWRSAYGPGTNGPGQPGTNYGGTHGCVNVPLSAMASLYAWTPDGTPVIVV